ncbi:hypothetical protein EST38_g1637 [Candolleomyces aberdarensis]|uniref:Nephrocystin 3-like N-terminal domain-containing protein n=1 Tax=Candolleomyces aberdarensis TaxID=2316362 RepID=A0A4Q2DY12_9AGAR|nr:hypothetical protein EST38_g1637 [Candolleomyces aberdarensis]
MSSVSYFKNAKNFVVNNSTFTTYVSGTDALQFLYEHSATGAMHDSEERFPPPMCHPGTREAVVIRITDWYGYQQGPGKPIMWVHAPAGYGKTAVAGTVSKILEETVGLDFSPLGATFFFWRTSPERNSPARFIITIAYQLAMSIPELAPHVESAVKRNPMILRKALEVQLVKLIIEPFKAVGEFKDIPKRLVIIDGLDEWINSEQESRVEKKYAEDQEKVQVRILELVHTLQYHHLPLSFLILSRPEAWIKQHIESRSFEDVVEIVDLYEVGDHMGDVGMYVQAELSRIAAKIGDEEWAGENTVQDLVVRSNGHMLYASTVIGHIDDPYDDPRERLENILDSSSDSSRDLAHSTPFSSLYELYRQIMRSCPANNHSLMIEVLEDIVVTRNYFPGNYALRRTLTTLDSLCGRAPGRGIRAIRGLHAVLRPMDTTYNPFFSLSPFIHSTFPEFLVDRQLSLEFAIDKKKGEQRLLWKCLECMSTVTMQTKLDEEHHLFFALHVFRDVWIGAWSGQEVVQSYEAEYLKAVHKVLVIDLTTCFIKFFSQPGSPFSQSLSNFRPPRRFFEHFGEEFEPLVQQVPVHFESSMDRALAHLLGQHSILNSEALSSTPFLAELADYVDWIIGHSSEGASMDTVRALKNLRSEHEEGFKVLLEKRNNFSHFDFFCSLLNYISHHEDNDSVPKGLVRRGRIVDFGPECDPSWPSKFHSGTVYAFPPHIWQCLRGSEALKGPPIEMPGRL